MHEHITTDKPVRSMRAGWTLIELIFILVILGILAAIAIPKLSASRDAAELSADVSNMNICIKDMSTIYTATGTDLNNIDSIACDKVICYTIDINLTHMVVDLNNSAPFYCNDIENVGGHLVGTFRFAGKGIAK